MGRPDPRRLAPGLIVVALTLGAAVPLARLFRAGGVWGDVLLAAGGSAAIAALARRFRFGPLASWLAQVAGLFLLLCWRFAPGTLVGPMPTARTLGSLGRSFEVGARLINGEAAPIPPHDEVLLFIALGVWVTTWLIDTSLTVIGNPLLAVASALPLFAVPGTLIPSSRRGLELATFVVPAAIAVWAHEDRRARTRGRTLRARPAIGVAVAALAGALALTTVLPGFGASPLLPGTGQRRQIFNPFVAIKPALDRSRETTLLTISTTRPGYLRLTALDRFDGKVWSQSDDQDRIAQPAALPPSRHDGSVVRVRQDVTIHALGGVWVPVAYDPVEVVVHDILGRSRTPDLDQEPRALILEDGIERGMRITAVSEVPVPSPRELDRARATPGPSLKRYLALPKLPTEIRDIARQVAGAEPTPFRKAVALQRYLRAFTYDEDVAAGHSFSTLTEFLTVVKRGYCEQFAGAMAVLARAQGLPSRVVIGFTAGQRLGAPNPGGPQLFEVTSRNAHAWVEIFFPDQGWILFEPTPRNGFARVPNYSEPSAADLAGTDVTPTATPTTSTGPSASPSARPSDRAAAGGSTGGGFPSLPVAALIATVLLAGAVVVVRRRGPAARATGYADLLAWCAAAGIGRRASETPREHLARIAGPADAAAALADPLDLALWAGVPQPDLDARLGGARVDLARRLGPGRRVRAGVRWRLGRLRAGVPTG